VSRRILVVRLLPPVLLIAALLLSGCGVGVSNLNSKGVAESSSPIQDAVGGDSKPAPDVTPPKPVTPPPVIPVAPDPIEPPAVIPPGPVTPPIKPPIIPAPPVTPPTPSPLPPQDPPATPTLNTEARIALEMINNARSTPQTCGGTVYAAVPPVKWNALLAAAADTHNRDMIARQYFEHNSPDGSNPGSRILAAGYDYAWYGENIAVGSTGSGLDTLAGAVAGWLSSAGHCKNIMNPNFTEMGLASASGKWTRFDAVYWTQEFGQPR
jgi:uncharacterized protein YkwD